jgi:anaerobic magnesium-protoporphyrin IX monomethyl ester cyclase
MIVLINPASTPSPRKPLPMSVLAVGSLLEGEFDYTIVDGNLEPDVIGRVTAIAERQPLTAIGMTVMPGPQLSQAVPLSRALKRQFAGVPIVWGGYFPSQHPEPVLHDDAIDYCIRGQGEQSFLALMRVLTHGGALDTVRGLSFRDHGQVRHNPLSALTQLDALPIWPYHRVEMSRYFHRHYLGSRVGAHHSTTWTSSSQRRVRLRSQNASLSSA